MSRKKTGETDRDALREQAEEVIRQSGPGDQPAPPATNDQAELGHELRVHEIELAMQNEELRRTQLELELARDRLADLFDFAPVGYLTLDGRGRIREANLTAAALLGKERESIIGRLLTHFVQADDQDEAYRHLRRVRMGVLPLACELRFVQADGDEAVVHVQSTSSHEPEGCRVALIDVTDRKRAEAQAQRLDEQLRQAQKLEAIGQLAGGVAHDFNNILTSVQGNVELLRSALAGRLRPDDPSWEPLAEIERSSQQAADLTRQLLAFARRQVVQPRAVCPARVLAGMESMLRRLIREDVELSIECANDTGNIIVDSGELQQAIVNLAVNARDAMPHGGRMVIRAENAMAHSSAPALNGETPARACVAVSVSDTGIGMDEETRQRMFEPFFTTKTDGTGLGLATVYGIVQKGCGRIEVESVPGRGTTIRMIWPRTSEAPSRQADSSTPSDISRGNETILLCEDNQAVRDVLLRTLRENGYGVIAVANADEAQQAAGGGAAIDLLLTDVLLPGMNGAELAARLTQAQPALRVILISGYAPDSLGAGDAKLEHAAFVPKPFTMRELLRKVRETLDSQRD